MQPVREMKKGYGGERRKPLEGTKVGFWSVGEYRGDGWYIATCACGLTKPVHAASLNQGKSRSCGCRAKEMNLARQEKMKAREKKFFPAKEKYE